MKKVRFNMPRLWGEKIILLVVFFVFILFFSTDFGLIDIQKTAIILAAGIDRTEEGIFNVTAQIAVPEASKSGGAAQAMAITGSGETIAEAFKEINTKTGWFPKLIFCDLIVLGDSVTDGDVFDCLTYFMRNEQMSDNCLLAACEGTAEETLNTKTPTESMTALALQKILATEAKESGNISTINLKDFAANYFSGHKSGYMPYIRLLAQAENAENGQSGGGSQTAAAAQDGAQGQSGGSSGAQNKVFDASRTAVFYNGKLSGILDEDESFALNLVIGSVRQATLEVPLDNGVTYALSLTDLSSQIKMKTENNIPRLTVRLKAVARVNDCTVPQTVEEIASTNTIPQEVLRRAESSLADNLSSLFEKCRAVNCDIFRASEKLRKFQPAFYKAYQDILLERTVADFKVSVKDSD